MAENLDAFENATSRLLDLSEQNLYLELGKRLQAVRRDPGLSGSFDLKLDSAPEAYGLADDLINFADRFLKRLNEQAFSVVCGSEATDVRDRQDLVNAFGLGKEAVAGALAALLVSQLFIAPVIAVVAAPIIVKLLFQPTHAAMCDVWRAKMEGKES
jgi:hypothetical protein